MINTATNAVDQTVTVGTTPYGIAITPNGEYAYVTNLVSVATESPVANWVGTVSVISTGYKHGANCFFIPMLVPEFPTQSLTIALLVCIIIVLSIVIIAKKKAEKSNLAKISQEKTSNSKNSTDQQAT